MDRFHPYHTGGRTVTRYTGTQQPTILDQCLRNTRRLIDNYWPEASISYQQGYPKLSEGSKPGETTLTSRSATLFSPACYKNIIEANPPKKTFPGFKHPDYTYLEKDTGLAGFYLTLHTQACPEPWLQRDLTTQESQ